MAHPGSLTQSRSLDSFRQKDVPVRKITAIAVVSCLLFFITESVTAVESQSGTVSPKKESVILKWLGTVGWEIRVGKTVILIDPFLSRREASQTSEWKTNEEAVLKVIEGADYIFAGHSHADHIADIPFIAKRFGPKVIGSRTTTYLAFAAGVPQSQLTTIKGGEKLDFPGFSVQVIESRHGWLRGKPPQNENVEISRPLGRSIIGRDFVDGGSFLYYFIFGNRRVLHQSTANFIEEKLSGLQPDLVLLADGHDGYNLERVLKALKPKVIIMQHFDEWRVPFSEGIQDRNTKRAERFKRDIAKIDSTIKVVIPHFFMTYALE